MALEIERKFLVHHASWKEVVKPLGNEMRQGYLHADIDKTIRVRATNLKGFLTLKGKTIGATRSEFEYEIPKAEAIELLDLFATSELHKTRYEILFETYIWEVDVFHGKNEGLIVAEIELPSEDAVFSLPNWVAQEVTEDNRYYNANLSKTPFQEW